MTASSHTCDRWATELVARARAYWTEARTGELARGKLFLLPPAEAAPFRDWLKLLGEERLGFGAVDVVADADRADSTAAIQERPAEFVE